MVACLLVCLYDCWLIVCFDMLQVLVLMLVGLFPLFLCLFYTTVRFTVDVFALGVYARVFRFGFCVFGIVIVCDVMSRVLTLLLLLFSCLTILIVCCSVCPFCLYNAVVCVSVLVLRTLGCPFLIWLLICAVCVCSFIVLAVSCYVFAFICLVLCIRACVCLASFVLI